MIVLWVYDNDKERWVYHKGIISTLSVLWVHDDDSMMRGWWLYDGCLKSVLCITTGVLWECYQCMYDEGIMMSVLWWVYYECIHFGLV